MCAGLAQGVRSSRKERVSTEQKNVKGVLLKRLLKRVSTEQKNVKGVLLKRLLNRTCTSGIRTGH